MRQGIVSSHFDPIPIKLQAEPPENTIKEVSLILFLVTKKRKKKKTKKNSGALICLSSKNFCAKCSNDYRVRFHFASKNKQISCQEESNVNAIELW